MRKPPSVGHDRGPQTRNGSGGRFSNSFLEFIHSDFTIRSYSGFTELTWISYFPRIHLSQIFATILLVNRHISTKDQSRVILYPKAFIVTTGAAVVLFLVAGCSSTIAPTEPSPAPSEEPRASEDPTVTSAATINPTVVASPTPINVPSPSPTPGIVGSAPSDTLSSLEPTPTVTPMPTPVPTATPVPERPPTAARSGAGGFVVLDYPEIVPASQVASLDPNELVLGLALQGHSRSYPVRMAWFHHIFNDELGGTPILVTY